MNKINKIKRIQWIKIDTFYFENQKLFKNFYKLYTSHKISSIVGIELLPGISSSIHWNVSLNEL